jgi:serine phosphatase RsbU (regulator of sigma subunit)
MKFLPGRRVRVEREILPTLVKAEQSLRTITGADRATIYLARGNGASTELCSDGRFATNMPGAVRIGIGESSMVSYTARHERMTRSTVPTRYPRDESGKVMYNQKVARKTGYEINTIATLPLVYQEQLQGAIQVMNAPEGFPPNVLSGVKAYGEMLARSIATKEPLRGSEMENRVIDATEELREMSRMQRLFLRADPPTKGTNWLDLEIRYLPSANVGGDWYDIGNVRGKRRITLGDMAGHGLQAHAKMIATSATHANFAETRGARVKNFPSSSLRALNTFVAPLFAADDQFHGTATTATFTKGKGGRRYMNWATAGHPTPLHLRNGEFINENMDKKVNGFPLGFMEEQFTEAKIHLMRGDYLLFFSDGANELPDLKGECLGERGLKRITRSSLKDGRSLDEGLNRIVGQLEVVSNGAVQSEDDITLIAARVN